MPGAILMAKDDPIIPVADFADLQLSPQLRLDFTEHGGHCGFIRDWSLASYAEDWLVAQLAAISA